MKIALVYIVVTNGPLTNDFASRFVGTWVSFPPGVQHDTLVVCNGGPIPSETGLIFSSMNPFFYTRKNDGGWDISAYMEVARGFCSTYDMMLCCGESIYFHKTGWMKRFVDAWNKYGAGMYGAFSSNLVRAHLNTTGFCCAPSAFLCYPKLVTNRKERYEFEHGQYAMWRRLSKLGVPVKLVTWDGEFDPTEWRRPANIMWRGDQSNCLFWCQHTDRFVKMDSNTKAHWSKNADRSFR